MSCCGFVFPKEGQMLKHLCGGLYAFPGEMYVQALCLSQGVLPVFPTDDFSLGSQVKVFDLS